MLWQVQVTGCDDPTTAFPRLPTTVSLACIAPQLVVSEPLFTNEAAEE